MRSCAVVFMAYLSASATLRIFGESSDVRAQESLQDLVGSYPLTIEKSGTGCEAVEVGSFAVTSVTVDRISLNLGGDPGDASFDSNALTFNRSWGEAGGITLAGRFERQTGRVGVVLDLVWSGLDCRARFTGSKDAPIVSQPESQPADPQSEPQSTVPPPTVIGGSGEEGTGETEPGYETGSDGNTGPIVAVLIGTVLVGSALLRRRRRKATRPTAPEFRSPATARNRSIESVPGIDLQELPELPSVPPEFAEEGEPNLGFGPPDVPPEMAAPEEEDPIARAKRAAKKAVEGAKAGMTAGAATRRDKPASSEPADPELAKLKRDAKEWERAETEERKPKPPAPETAKAKTELEKLKEEAKRAEEEAAEKELEELEKTTREIEEEEKREREYEERRQAELKKMQLEAAEAEKERQRKEAEAARQEAERAAAEEAELKLKREERARARREEEAKEEAREAEEAAREAEREKALREAETKAASKSAEPEDWTKQADEWHREDTVEKARAELNKERERLRNLGFSPHEIAEYKRDQGILEYGTFARSADRMGRAEFISEWAAFGADKGVDLLSSLAGPNGTKVKDAYTVGKNILGQTVGDVLPGGEGITAARLALGVRDAAVDVGIGKVLDKLLDVGALKLGKVAEGYDISDSASYWPKAFGAGWHAASSIRATAYVKALIGTAEGIFYDVIWGDRMKNMLKKDPPGKAANAFEKYILGFPSE